MSSVAKSKARSLSNPSINMAGVPEGRRGAWEVADGVAVKAGGGVTWGRAQLCCCRL